MNAADFDFLAVMGDAFGPTGLAVTLTFFAMGVVALGAVTKLYRWVFRRPERPLSQRFLVKTGVIITLTVGSWVALVEFAQIIPLWFVGVVLFMTALTWLWLTLLTLKMIAYARSAAVLGAAQVASAVSPKRSKVTMPPSPLEAVKSGKSGPVETVPTLAQRLASGMASGKIVQWAPFAVGLVVMTVSAILFQISNPAAGGVASAEGFPDLGRMMSQSRIIIFGSVAFGAVLLLLVARYAAHRTIPYADDPWARLERLAATERARK